MSTTPKISMIAAIGSKTRVIGTAEGKIPWHISEDFKHFKTTTMGHPIIMGRTTFEGFGGRLLPGRPHIVVTRQGDYRAPEGVYVANSIEGAIRHAKTLDANEVFIIGGAQIYEACLPLADRLYITVVETDLGGPAKFPEYENKFCKIVSSRKSRDENFEYEFLVLEK